MWRTTTTATPSPLFPPLHPEHLLCQGHYLTPTALNLWFKLKPENIYMYYNKINSWLFSDPKYLQQSNSGQDLLHNQPIYIYSALGFAPNNLSFIGQKLLQTDNVTWKWTVQCWWRVYQLHWDLGGDNKLSRLQIEILMHSFSAALKLIFSYFAISLVIISR